MTKQQNSSQSGKINYVTIILLLIIAVGIIAGWFRNSSTWDTSGRIIGVLLPKSLPSAAAG